MESQLSKKGSAMTPPDETVRTLALLRDDIADAEYITANGRKEQKLKLAALDTAIAHLRRESGETRTPDWRQVVLSLWGDPEDCADCLDLSERPCAVHANIELGRQLAQPISETRTLNEEDFGRIRAAHRVRRTADARSEGRREGKVGRRSD
jgi:hypothetical protein